MFLVFEVDKRWSGLGFVKRQCVEGTYIRCWLAWFAVSVHFYYFDEFVKSAHDWL